ncbi:MAG TPA: hypothetical protein VFO39_08245 [Candidatus Sulfotelmatobacter sp.]|nr:hypothetical protein [Candidatus Sulfotelmatobacter sp.]
MAFASAISPLSGVARATRAAASSTLLMRGQAAILFSMALARKHGSQADVYNILWGVVFGFATLNILGLAARRMEPGRRGMSFGEILAVMVVVLAVVMLAWELLTIFHIFPIKLRR